MTTHKKYNLLFSLVCAMILYGCSDNTQVSTLPADIEAIFNKPIYKEAIWGLRVVDIDSGKLLVNQRPQHPFFIASVRKIFSIGQLLDTVGPTHRYNTPVYRQGSLDEGGTLHGNLILVASGDLTMGGRTLPDGSIAISEYDHNEANGLGNAILTSPNPLAGYIHLAQQVAQSGIKHITGDVIIDDRLFKPFYFRNEFNLSPIFVNDDVIDVNIHPNSTVGQPAAVTYRPMSAALTLTNQLITGPIHSTNTLTFAPNDPTLLQCIGNVSCNVTLLGNLPIDFIPPLTGQFPLVQTVRITQPANYARTVFIEALEAAGVQIDAPILAHNPTHLLPEKNSYSPAQQVAELTGLPYSENAKLVMKVSYNIGADASMLLWGLTQGVDNMNDALKAEQRNLKTNFNILKKDYQFLDGSGGGKTQANNQAVVTFLTKMVSHPSYQAYLDAFPILGVDGSLGFVKDFQSNETLIGATGQVHAKTGTYITVEGEKIILKGQSLAGYIHTQKGRRLAFQLVVNHVPIQDINQALQVFQDTGIISAILWRDN